MAKTIHRKDITHENFRVLAAFRNALLKLEHGPGDYLKLKAAAHLRPQWYEAVGGWKFHRLVERNQVDLAISVRYFNRICKYIRVDFKIVVNTLYKCNLMAVKEGGEEPKKFFFPVTGREGNFIFLEQRRIRDGFAATGDDDTE